MNYAPVGYVYALRNTTNGKCYVGSTTQVLRRRLHLHFSLLRRGRHHSYKLQSAWDSVGAAAFSVEVLRVCAVERLCEVEQQLLAQASYNIADDTRRNGIGRRWIGHVKKEYRPVGLSNVRRAEWANQDIRARRIAGLRAALAKPETRERKARAQRGRVMTAEAVARSARAKWRPVFCAALQCTFLSQKHAAAHFGVCVAAVANAVKHGCKIGRVYDLQRVCYDVS